MNILFQDLELFKEGESYFKAAEYSKAYKKFIEFSDKYPNGATFVAGRIAITLMKLGKFEQARQYLKTMLSQNLLLFPNRERDYNCLYAECLYALGEIKESEAVCFNVEKKYPEENSDLERILKRVSIHPHLKVLLTYMDWNERKECLQALESIIEILSNKEGNTEEAIQYSLSLINCSNNYSALPYLILKDHYNKPDKWHLYPFLLNKLEHSMLPLVERNKIFDEIMKIYRQSPEFPYSVYFKESESSSALNPLKRVISEVENRVKYLSITDFIQYVPNLNLEKYFARELQVVIAA